MLMQIEPVIHMVEFAQHEKSGGTRHRIVATLPRHTEIKRGAAGEHYHQQVIAANIDTVFIVCGLDADFNPRRIERYLLLVGGGGAQTAAPEPVIVLTKADRTEYADDAVEVLADLTAQGVPVFTVSRTSPRISPTESRTDEKLRAICS